MHSPDKQTESPAAAGEERYRREAEFHDAVFSDRTRDAVARYYSITHGTSKNAYRAYISSHCRGKRVLEYGCGPDGHARLMAREGGRVTGIDISPVAVAMNRDCMDEGASATFCVMNAEQLAFSAATFDLICGMGILHHLDLDRAYPELSRILKPDGSAIFLEPLGHNPVINLYRRFTPGMRTEDEHPLLMKDMQHARDSFRSVDLQYFHLTSIASAVLRTPALAPILEKLDQRLFGWVPWLRKHAWAAVMVLSQPKHAPGAISHAQHACANRGVL